MYMFKSYLFCFYLQKVISFTIIAYVRGMIAQKKSKKHNELLYIFFSVNCKFEFSLNFLG